MTWGEFRPAENKVVSDMDRVDLRHEIKLGDILVSRANTRDYVGAPVLVRRTRPRLLLSDKSLRLKVASDIDPDWLVSVLASPVVRRQISEKSTGNQESMRNISQSSLMGIRIPQYGLDRQREVAARVAERRSAIQRLDVAVERAVDRGSALRRSLLADAFAGRLAPQDPTDEPASVLLDRIRAERAARPSASGRRKNRNQEMLA